MDSMQFLQLIPRIRVYEKKLLDKAQIERMIDANTSEGALKVLQETEYAAFMNEVRRPDDYEILLSNELVRLYKTMYEASPLKEIIDVMALKYDYHNIKVLVKGKILDKDFSQMLIPVGMVGVNDLKSAINGEDFGRLPKKMEECLRKIFEKFEETNDPQFIDLIADQYLYAHIHEIANKKNIKEIKNGTNAEEVDILLIL